MTALKQAPRRRAFTLVELMVVMALILVLVAIGGSFLYGLRDDQKQTRAIDMVQQWLLTAKQRAKRDQVIVGVRLMTPNAAGQFTQIAYVQQPDNFSAPAFSTCQISAGIATFTGADLIGPGVGQSVDNYLIHVGDYLFLDGQIYYILTPPTPGGGGQQVQLGVPWSPDTSVTVAASPYWTIFRQPRLLTGETPTTLPENLVIMPPNANNTTPCSMNVPVRTVGNQIYYEILFSPSGAVAGPSVSGGMIFLWVQDTSLPQTDPASSSLVAIQSRTGFISSHPTAPYTPGQPYSASNNPFAYAQDGRSSGM